MGELDSKVVVVTGATAGVGKETARGLLKLGATVVAVARDAKKGEAVLGELRASTGNERAHLVTADVSVMKSLRDAATKILAAHPKLHAVVHNAAVIPLQRTTTSEGLEMSFAANTAGPLVFTRALLPGLTAGAPSRVVFLVGASEPIPLDDVQFEKSYQPWHAYQRTKFGALMVLKHLTQTLPAGVVAHGAFPGIVNTPGMDDAINAQEGVSKLILKALRPFMRTPARGAFAPIWVASAKELENQTGKLWSWKEPLGRPIKGWDDEARANELVARIDSLVQPLVAS